MGGKPNLISNVQRLIYLDCCLIHTEQPRLQSPYYSHKNHSVFIIRKRLYMRDYCIEKQELDFIGQQLQSQLQTYCAL